MFLGGKRAKNDLKLPISVCFAPYLRNCRSYHRDFDNDIYRCFSLYFFKKCNIVNIKIICSFCWPTSRVFLIIICFSSSSINAERKFRGVPHLHIVIFFPSCIKFYWLSLLMAKFVKVTMKVFWSGLSYGVYQACP